MKILIWLPSILSDMASKIIFGYGSLINLEDLKATASDAFDIRPCYIRGFIRDFSVLDPVGFSESNLDVGGLPYCALDVRPSPDKAVRVNGVIFRTNEGDFKRLVQREQNYNLIKTIAYDFHTNEPLGDCVLFSANKNNGNFDFKSEVQMRYLQICLKGARQYGDAFYQEFLGTTYIDAQSLINMSELLTQMQHS